MNPAYKTKTAYDGHMIVFMKRGTAPNGVCFARAMKERDAKRMCRQLNESRRWALQFRRNRDQSNSAFRSKP